MRFSRNKFNDIVNCIYCSCLLFSLAFFGMAIMSESGLPAWSTVPVVLVSIGILFLACRFLPFNELKGHADIIQSLYSEYPFLESVLVIVMLLIGIIVRAVLFGNAAAEGDYYTAAQVSMVDGTNSHIGVTSLYVNFLNKFFFYTGNFWKAGILMQILLQMVTIIMLYPAMRILAGKASASITFLMALLMPASVMHSLTYSPKILFAFFFAGGLLLMAFTYQASHSFWTFIYYTLLVIDGLYIAYLSLLNLYGILLLILMIAIVFHNRSNSKLSFSGSQILTWSSFVIGLLLISLVGSVMHRVGYSEYLKTLINSYTGHFKLTFPTVFANSIEPYLLICLLLPLGIIAFTRREKDLNTPWILVLLFTVLPMLIGFEDGNGSASYVLLLELYIMAGISVYQMMFLKAKAYVSSPKGNSGRSSINETLTGDTEAVLSAAFDKIPEEEQKQLSEIPAIPEPEPQPSEAGIAEPAEEMLTEEIPEALSVPEEEPMEPATAAEPVEENVSEEEPAASESPRQLPQEPIIQEESIMDQPEESDQIKIEDPAPEQAENFDILPEENINPKVTEEIAPTETVFIENPLPLPKKHVKKIMDYPRKIAEDKLSYDIEVDENDDYDYRV